MSLSKEISGQDDPASSDQRIDAGTGDIEDYVRRLSTNDIAHIDDVVLRANGHEAVLQRQFKWISALGLGFSITNSWIGYLVSLRHPDTQSLVENADLLARATLDRT